MADLRPTFHWLDLDGVTVADAGSAPAIIAPLVEAAEGGRDLAPVVGAIVKSLGFDTFMYGLSIASRPGQDSLMYTFTNAPREWVIRWDQAAYVEIDPRIQHAVDSTLPFIWDKATSRGKSQRVDKFLDDARHYGICSGVSFVLPDRNQASVIMCFNSSVEIVDIPRRGMIDRNLGSMLTFGYYFHELFMRQVVRRGVASHFQGAPLSARERECLLHAANGLTTDEIAARLGIKPRTAQFHFDSIRTKLAVATRQEAVARGLQQRLIDIDR